jgi:superfamily II DNA or RNA helicase
VTNLGPKDPKQEERDELTRDEDFGVDDPPEAPDDDGDDGDALPEIPRGDGDHVQDEGPLPQTPATLAIARMSERLLSRTVGMNAYQKGRGYARRGHVLESSIEGWAATGRVHGRAAEPYVVRVDVSELGTFTSACTCPAWRGPERHCKHVAALLVALRDRMKPLREAAMQQAAQVAQAQHTREDSDRRKVKGRRSHRGEAEHPREVVVLDRSGSRLVGSVTPAVSTLPTAPGTVVSGETRMNWQVWLPPTDPRRAPEFEYRLQLRPMAIAVTAFNAESRTAMTPDAALEALGPSMSPHRSILRVLSRNARGARQAAVELRGEDAAELLTLLRGRRVLIEPTLMELRFVDDPLIPKLELESAGASSVRAKVVFERKSDGRKYSGGQGLWFEGTPTWQVDTVQGIARTVADSVTPAWLERLSRAPMILHPVEDLGRLLGEIVPKVALALGTELPDLSTVATLVDITPTFMLRAEGDLSKVRATLRACYGDVELDVPPADLPPPLAIVPPPKTAHDDEDAGWAKPRVIRRDIGAERMAADRLFELGLGLPEEHSGWFEASGDKAVSFWMEGVGSLPDDWDRFIPDDLMHVQVRDTPVTPRARVGSGVDWLSLDVEFVSEGSKVNEEDLRRALLEGRRLVRLEDGTFAPVSREQVDEVLLRMAEIFAQGRQHIPLSQAGRVQDLLRLLPGARVEPAAKDLLARLADHGMVEQVAQPKSLHATMRPYQIEGFSWLVFLHRAKTGGVLADDMGLGKTLQTLALLAWLKEDHLRALDAAAALAAPAAEAEKPAKVKKVVKKKAAEPEPEPAKAVKPKKGAKKAVEEAAAPAPVVTVVADPPKRAPLTLVVAPTSVVTNWLREVTRFAPSLRAVAWTGPDREKRLHELDGADVVITSYALLRRDEEFLQRYEFAYAILDEAQNIKNPLSATARAAKRLRSQRRLALTGTPIENRLSEIWSIFDFLSPGMLGDLATFEERYARPIDRGDAEAIRRLRGVIRPLVLRRTKSEVAKDLPARIVVEREVDLPVPQRALYQQVLGQVRANVFGEIDRVGIGKSQIMILAGLTRLRQAACDPRLLKVPGDFKDEDAGKLDALREIIQEAIQSGHRTLVFSQFVEMLSLIRKALERDGVTYEYLDGSTKDRQDRVDHFNRNESVPVFLISLKAGGSGLNLTGADTVVHFDPWWNPAVEDQATDRAHRIGQTRVVTAYRLIARQTIEEKIMQLGAKKRELVSSVLGAEENVSMKGLTRADVEMLFSEEGSASE